MSQGKKVRWTIASARQEFPTVVSLAAREPQDIYRRDKLVARVVAADDAAATAPEKPGAAELLARIQQACLAEDFSLDVPPRDDRPNPFVKPRRSRKRR